VRAIVWFSCGAASAVAGQMAITKYGHELTHLVYCDVSKSEHPDNMRFLADVEKWLDHKVEVIRSERYADIDDVFEKTRYMAGVAGARCTAELKKKPRFAYQRPDDIHIFGLMANEEKRIQNMISANPELTFDWILRDGQITKIDCYQRLGQAGITMPVMYLLGFDHNNCIGCVKAQSPAYWLNVKAFFPKVFDRRSKQSREIGCKLSKLEGRRVFIDEIPEDAKEKIQEDLSCGPDCGFGPAGSVAEMRQRLIAEGEWQ
jgi:hypothetical protein